MTTIDPGDIPLITTLVVDEAGDPANPATREGRWMAPSGLTGTMTPQLTSTTGTVRTEGPVANERGRWYFWLDFGDFAEDGYWDVDHSPAAPASP